MTSVPLQSPVQVAPPVRRGRFLCDAQLAVLEQEPVRAKLLLKAFWLVLALGIGFAAITKVDEVTRGEAKVIPSRQLQVLQSLDGGVVSEILP